MIYLLTTSKGSWDFYEHINIGVTTCPFEADKLKQEWLVKLKEKQSMYSLEEKTKYEEEIKNNDFIPDYLSRYLDWSFENYDDYSKEVNIKEIKENTIICNNLKD